MKVFFFPAIGLLFCLSAKASDKDSTSNYTLPDSVKAVQFMTEITVQSADAKKASWTGIRTDAGTLALTSGKSGRKILFECYGRAMVKVVGLGNRERLKGEIVSDYDWQLNETYKLLIAVATDSAENFSIYSGYIFLPKENKWKLVGSYEVSGRWNTIQQPRSFFTGGKKGMQVNTGQVWVQRNTGSWKNVKEGTQTAPVINLFGHVDSVAQRSIDMKMITDSISAGKTDAVKNIDGVYYSILKEGTGRQVSINDTVVAYYKGYLFSNGRVFDQTKDKPATFPLKRLIRGWQIGVPLCNVGGKIKLIIPSDMAYSIRTRAAKIPPNSILVFEIEVVEVKSPQ